MPVLLRHPLRCAIAENDAILLQYYTPIASGCKEGPYMQNPRAMIVISRGMRSCLEMLQPFSCKCSDIHDGEQQSQWTVPDNLVNFGQELR